VIKVGKLTTYAGKGNVAAVEQVSYIGYNGTAGAFDAQNSTDYFLRIAMTNEQNTFGDRLMYFNGEYTSDASATQAEVATGLAKSLAYNSRFTEQYLKVELLSAHAGAAATGTGDITATKGSTLISATDIDAVATVGDYIRLGGLTTAFAVYKIVAMDTTANTATLDFPFQGTSDTFIEATEVEVITAANAAGAAAGIKLTGVAKTYIPGVFRYYKNRFKIQLKNGGTTNIYEPGTSPAVGANEGSGTTEQVQELEWFMQGNLGRIYRLDPSLPVTPIANVVPYLAATTNTGFAQLILNFYDDSRLNVIENTSPSAKSVIIAAPASAVAGGAGSVGTNFDGAADNTSVADVLDAFAVLSANGATALTNTWYV
jgi:hypothetical protein